MNKLQSRYGRMLRRHFCAVMAGVLLFLVPMPVYATSTVSQKESELSNAEGQKSNLEDKLSKLQDIKDELESSRRDLSSYVTELDAELNSVQLHISELNQLMEEKEDEIEDTKARLEEAKRDEVRQYLQMKQRIRFMYEQSESTYMQLLMTSTSFSDMLNKATYIEQLSAYDRNMLVKYKETKEAIVDLQKNLEEEQEVLQATVDEAAENESAMETMIADKQEQIEAYDADIANKEAAIKEYEDQIAAQDALIKSLEAAVAAAKAAASTSGNNAPYSGGTFAWPAPSYTRISDDYGWRIHPTLGVQQFHNGIDMAAPSGTAILAAADGEVIAASYSSTMGNYIMINHGSNLYTIYMHASSLGVSKGAKVSKGQQIATVGSTGRSTGPHLHFSVRLNGSYVSPWTYLKG